MGLKVSKINVVFFLVLLTVFHIQDFLKLGCFINLDFWVMNAMVLLALIQDLLDFEDTLAHVVVHISLLGLVDLFAVIHDHGGPS